MLLEIENLSITFETQRGPLPATREISFSLNPGETLGIVGESGCGKSITNLAIMGLLPKTATVSADKLNFNGLDLLKAKEREFRKVRGKEISMIFQDPMSSLNPCFTVGDQIDEMLRAHNKGLSKKERFEKILYLLDKVGIPAPLERIKSYPHELSGGMAQRVMIAMAISCSPKLLIADEPTTALDVTIQKQIMDLLKKLQEETKMAMILVTHDLGVVAQNSDFIQVMYAGEVVEKSLSKEIIQAPMHPYTKGLLNSLPGEKTVAKEKLQSIPGMVPNLFERSNGCQFSPRCFKASEKCHITKQSLTGNDHLVRCQDPLR